MKFKPFYDETSAPDGSHKHLSLERSSQLKEAIRKEFSAKINPLHADDIIFDLTRRYEEKWMLLRERKMTNSQVESFLDRNKFIRPPGWRYVFFYPDSFQLRTPFLLILAIIISALIYSSL